MTTARRRVRAVLPTFDPPRRPSYSSRHARPALIRSGKARRSADPPERGLDGARYKPDCHGGDESPTSLHTGPATAAETA